MSNNKITYNKLAYSVELINSLIPKEKSETQTKLKYAVQKFAKSVEKVFADYNEKVSDINILHASEDEKGNLIMNGGIYTYTKAAQKERLAELNKLGNEHLFDFNPYILTDEETIKKIDPFIAEELKGVFIKAD
jgi:hypothetical protein